MFLGVFRVQVFHMHTKKIVLAGNTLKTVQSKKYETQCLVKVWSEGAAPVSETSGPAQGRHG